MRVRQQRSEPSEVKPCKLKRGEGEVLTMVTGTLLHFHLLIVTQPRRRKSTSRERMSMQIKSQPPG